jgi:hypothetical protein
MTNFEYPSQDKIDAILRDAHRMRSEYLYSGLKSFFAVVAKPFNRSKSETSALSSSASVEV